MSDVQGNHGLRLKPTASAREAAIRDHLRALEGVRDPETDLKATQAALGYLQEQMQSFGLEVAQQALDLPGGSLFPNLIARSRNALSSQSILVLGAHYDTVAGSPGADDNASSLAVLLEAARILTPLRGRLALEFVGFSMEESGFLGSKAYLSKALKTKKPVQSAIILECVGYTDPRPGSQKTPPGLPLSLPDQGDFIGVLGSKGAGSMQEAFASAARKATPELPVVSLLVPDAGRAFPDTRRSDHVPFWDRGIPAIMLTDTADFRNPHYHRSSDRIETLDIPFIAQVTQALCACVIQLAELGLGEDK